jgi:hypothetical protein
MVERRTALLGGLDKHFKIGACRGLPDKFGEPRWAQCHIQWLITPGRGGGKIGQANALT